MGPIPGALPFRHARPLFPRECGCLELLHRERNWPPGTGLQKLLEIFKWYIVRLNNTDFTVSRNEASPSSHLPPPQSW